MRLTLCALVAASLAGCVMPKGSAADGGAAGSNGGSGIDGGATATGAGCAQDPQTGVTLCAAVSLCPNVVVDTDLYPDCGFRIRGQIIDLECLCSGSLCPIGVATTCAQATQLLAAQNATLVCSQVNEGRCANATPTPAPSGSAGNGCDHACSSECGGDPGCIRSCGC
jgi:hypothetical protein